MESHVACINLGNGSFSTCCYQREVGDRKKGEKKQGKKTFMSESVFFSSDIWSEGSMCLTNTMQNSDRDLKMDWAPLG